MYRRYEQRKRMDTQRYIWMESLGPVQTWSMNIACCTNLVTALVWTGFRQCPLCLLSNKLLKHQLQICRRFHHSQDVSLVVCEDAWFRAVACLNNVNFQCPSTYCQPTLNRALVFITKENERKRSVDGAKIYATSKWNVTDFRTTCKIVTKWTPR